MYIEYIYTHFRQYIENKFRSTFAYYEKARKYFENLRNK